MFVSRHNPDLVAATGKLNFTQTHTRMLHLAAQCKNLISWDRTRFTKIKEKIVFPRLYQHPIKIFSVEYSYRSHFNYPKQYLCYRILVPDKVLARRRNYHVLILGCSSSIGFQLWHSARTHTKWSFWYQYVTFSQFCVFHPFCVTFHDSSGFNCYREQTWWNH